MGVKSHSSSIEDAQADRARRKADREGLRRPVQPEEPAPPAKKAAASKKAAAANDMPATEDGGPDLTPVGEREILSGASPAASSVGSAPPAPAAPVKRAGARLVTSRPASEQPSAPP